MRHTVLKRPGAVVDGAVWLTLFERGARPRAMRVRGRPQTPGDDWLTVAGCRIDGDGARGAIASGATEARWSIGVTPLAAPADHLPAERLYETALPRTKSRSPVPAARLDGELVLGEDRIDLTGWTGMVGHNWGSEHAERWIWLHAADERGWIDVALGRVRVGPVLLPWAATGHVALDGRVRRVRPGPRPVREATQEGARLRLGTSGGSVEAVVRMPSDSAVAWRYASPDGDDRLTLNCSVADLRLTHRGEVLEFPGAAAYELGGEPETSIPLAAPEPG